MAYIGKTPTIGNFQKCDAISVVNGQAAYTLQVGGSNISPQSENHMLVSLNGILQAPTDSFTVSGSTITFASALSTGDVIDFVMILGNVLDLGVPSDNTVSTAKISDSAITPAKLGYDYNQYRNIIINGDMSIAQRGTSQASAGSGSGLYQTVDRYKFLNNNLGVFTISQDTDVPSGQGFAKSLKLDCTSADVSPASGDYLLIQVNTEGQNLQYLKKGTTNAQSLTLSFWVKAVKTGTFIVDLVDVDNNRTISQSYTINSASTWEKKTLTFAGDTTGAFGNDNGKSLECNFWLGAGTDFTSGTLQTSWGTQVSANRVVGQVNLADSTDNEWYITGVQLEAGTTASDFEFLPYDVNLRRCQRYYFLKGSGANQDIAVANYYTTSDIRASVAFPVTMRAVPSIDVTAVSNGYTIRRNGGEDNLDDFTINNPSLTSTQIINSSDVSGTAGQAGLLFTDNSGCFLAFTSEL